MASDGVCRHMGAWTSCRVVTYASIRLSLSATTPWDEEEGSTLHEELALDPREVARQRGILSQTHRSTGSSLYIQSAAASRQVEQG